MQIKQIIQLYSAAYIEEHKMLWAVEEFTESEEVEAVLGVG